MVVVLILASGAAWESPALGLLEREPGVVVLRRCVDVPDLLAAASAGQADVAVLALEAPGPRPGARSTTCARFQVRPVAVVPARRCRRAPPAGRPARHRDRRPRRRARRRCRHAVQAADEDADADTVVPGPRWPTSRRPPSGGGRVLAVWGPAGAPGRTTVAVAVAAELAARGRRTTLVDADPYGGAVAQQLGILDEVSGLLAAARLAAGGHARARGSGRCSAPSASTSPWSPACRAPTGGSRSAPASSSTCSRSRPRTATSSSTPASASRPTRPASSGRGRRATR